MVNIKDLFQHFAVEEREFVDKLLDLCRQVEETYSYRLTPFLNPRQEEIVATVAVSVGLAAHSSRTFLETEWVRMVIVPAYYCLDWRDFEIQALKFTYPEKFYQLTHPQILGAMLNQLGIQRSFLGDILVGAGEAVVLVDQKFADLTQNSISKIAAAPIAWQETSWLELTLPITTSNREQTILVSSRRLDKLVATVFSLARKEAAHLIATGQVSVAYTVCKQAAKTIEIGQLVSVRRHGRMTLKVFLGQSKQGKLKFTVEMIRN